MTPSHTESPEFYTQPQHGWTCFHCGETFTTFGAARDHFGENAYADPGCLLRVQKGEELGLLMALRKAEAQLARYRAEDSDTERAMAAMRVDHAQALIREEEKGYARGLRDARKPFTPHPTGSVEFAAQLEHLGVPAPWRLCDEEVGVILASDGAPGQLRGDVACRIGPDETLLPDEDRTVLAMYIILAVNTFAGFKAVVP